MGICMDTGRNGFVNGHQDAHGSSFGSWPRQLNGTRVQSRTMSEPIMASQKLANGIVDADFNANSSSSGGPGPPKRINLTLQRRVEPFDSSGLTDSPIIFVLGGPGSGKITHCDHLARNDSRLVHINMQSAFLDVASEIGSKDPNIVPAYKAMEVLVSRLSEQKGAGALIVTGYPRNMRDVVEYLARIQRMDGIVLLDWSDRSLERQIQMGAKTGGIDVELARYEMNNYRANIIPVAQFFSQQGHLSIVAGQRPPGEIYEDLAEEINGILFHSLGERPPQMIVNNGDEPPLEDIEIDKENLAEETEVDVHTSAGEKRKDSIDSVDLMIAEEIKNITDNASSNPENPENAPKSGNIKS